MNPIIEEACRFRPPPEGRLVLWELTRFCNLACKHCCTESSPAVSTRDDLETERALTALGEFREAGIRELYITGGEPLARRDFIELLLAAGQVDSLDVFVATNGTFIRDRHVAAFGAAGVRSITISVDGYDAATHDAIRGPGAFAKTRKGIRRCVEAGLAVRLSHMITPASYPWISKFCEFAIASGVPVVALHTIIPAGTARSAAGLLLQPSLRKVIEQGIKQAQEDFAGDLIIQHGLDGNDNPKHCIAGRQLLHFAPNGDVSPCSWMYKLSDRFVLGNLRRESLASCLHRLDAVAGGYTGKPGCPIPVLARRNLPLTVREPADSGGLAR